MPYILFRDERGCREAGDFFNLYFRPTTPSCVPADGGTPAMAWVQMLVVPAHGGDDAWLSKKQEYRVRALTKTPSCTSRPQARRFGLSRGGVPKRWHRRPVPHAAGSMVSTSPEAGGVDEPAAPEPASSVLDNALRRTTARSRNDPTITFCLPPQHPDRRDPSVSGMTLSSAVVAYGLVARVFNAGGRSSPRSWSR